MNIITYGTFDLFHIGHLKLLKRCRSLADGKLIVGVSTDEFNALKGKKSVLTFKQRVDFIEELGIADVVIPETHWEQKFSDIEAYKATLVMGDDWKGKFDEFGAVYLPRTPGISSSEIRLAIPKA